MSQGDDEELEPLGPEVTALLGAAYASPPPAGVKDRGRSRLRAGIAASAAIVATAHSARVAAGTPATMVTAKGWLIAGTLSLGAAIAGGLAIHHARVWVRPPAPLAPSNLGHDEHQVAAVASTLALEQALLREARQAIAAADLAAANRLLDSHEQRFPQGALTEERETLRIIIAARAGNLASARARADVFRRRFPNSIQLPVIDHATLPRPGRR